MDTEITKKLSDQATAAASLLKARNELDKAIETADATMDALRVAIVELRPSGILTVEEMAAALGRDRNYVDSTWSALGETHRDAEGRVQQTRVSPQGVSETARKQAAERLSSLGRKQKDTAAAVTSARSERDRVVAMVYASKLLGPSAIADRVGVDRNHVLRITRRRGVGPMHRESTRNQYSA